MNKEIYMVIIREYVKRILNLFENGTYLHKRCTSSDYKNSQFLVIKIVLENILE